MSYDDPGAEEKTLETFFAVGKFTPGGETSQLRDACTAVEHFIAQELCGNLANAPTFDELWIHFQAILTRIFGKQDGTAAAPAGVSSSTYGTPVESSWMFAATSYYRVPSPADRMAGARSGSAGPTSSGGTRAGDPRFSGMEVMALPLLKLLLARPTDQPSPANKNLFGVLLEPQKVWYKFSCTSPPMPPHSLAFLRHEARPDAVLFENSRLYTHCLSSPPSVFPQAGMPRHGVRFHDAPGGGAVDMEGAAEAAKVAPELNLSTLEYYLFTFAWYAQSSSGDFYAGLEGPGRMPPVQHRGGTEGNYRPDRVALGWRSHGIHGLTRKNPYMTLLRDYMEAFFPHGNGEGICGGGEGGSGGMSIQGELLLRVLVEFWLEGNAVLRPGVLKEEEHQQHHQQQHQQQQVWGNMNVPNEYVATPATTRTTSSYDPTIALLWNDFAVPTDLSLHGLLVASTHLLADPRLRETCRRLEATATMGSTGGSSGAVAVAGGGGTLTPALEVLRPHVFSFLRVAFSPESTMHTSSATFSLAVELWMLWMRPWAAPAVSKGGSPDSTKLNPSVGAATACGSNRSGVGSSSSSSAAASGRRAGDGTGGVDAWVNLVASGVKEFFQIEPSGALAGSSRGGNQAAGAGGTGRGGGGGGHSGATAAGRRDSGVYCYDPWGGWVLENYSLYTTVLAAFVRKVGNMSFKVNDGSRDSNRRNDANTVAHVFADTGGANLRLVHRVVEVFSPGVTSLLASAQNSVRTTQRNGGGGGGSGDRGKELSDAQREVLEGGRKAYASIQGPALVTLENYRDVAEELLITLWDLANPRVSRDWMTKLENLFGDPGSSKTTERAGKISAKVKELFGLPKDWKPKGNEGGGAANGAVEVANMFHPDREKETPLFLSRQGKAQLLSGQRACKPWDVAYVGDPMYRPRRAWEMRVLISFWVWLSETVNDKWLGWTPPDNEEGESSSSERLTFEDEGSGKAVAQGREFQRRVWREGRWAKLPHRVNLRPLADLRATLGLVFSLVFLWLSCHVSLSLGAFLATSLSALAVRLSTMD